MPANSISMMNGGAHTMNGDGGFGAFRPDQLYHGEVSISGISGRYPESNNIQEFQEHLLNNEDMVTVDNRRWEPGYMGLPTRNGKLKNLGVFDSTFFGVHGKQADSMDPQLKMLLEASYEAIVDAGQSMESIKGSRTGVFIGNSQSESAVIWFSDPDKLVNYSLSGCARNMFANRISYFFDLKGPSYTVDSACSATAMCVDQALQSIRMGVIDAALVGGANLCLQYTFSMLFLKLGMLAPDGSCKAFDSSGNGYVRSEAVNVIYLQKSKDCKRIYATLVHAKSNCDGYKVEGVTFPSGAQQNALIREVYEESGVNPLDVAYIEAHGTGTKVGDPQELNSLADVFCKGRKEPVLIGSVKSNMGHSECCSGLNAISKVIIAMESQIIPANLHFNEPNPEIASLNDGRFKVVTENTRWKGGLVGLNSFGFGGSNVHMLFRSNQKEFNEPHFASQKARLFTYCGHTEDGVRAVLAEAKKNASSVEFQSLMEPSANIPLSMLPYRGYTVLNSSTELEGVEKNRPDRRPVWFVFAGMGGQWHGMGRKMMELEVFRNSIKRSTKYLSRYDVDLYDLIMNGDETTFDQTIPSFIGITGIQVALVDVLFAMGIRPDGIVGHSLGELGCGYADGSLTAEEAVLAGYWRGRCISEATIPAGKMAAVGLTWEECKKLCPEGVVPACHNAIDTVTISGPYDTTTKFVEELKAQGIFARDVKSSNVAFHSYFMDPIAPQLKDALDKIIVPKKRSPKWISTSVPENRWSEELAQYSSADYHVNNLVSAVLFQEGLQKIPSNAVAIEIGPHCLLQAILKRSLSTESVIVGTMKRFHENNQEFFFQAIGKCYANGVDVDPLSIFPPVEYPVPRGTPMISPAISKIWDHSDAWKTPVHENFLGLHGKGGASTDSVFDVDISEESPDEYLVGHKIDGRVLFPATGYLVLAWKALAKIKGKLFDQMPVTFQNVHIQRATVLPPTGKVSLSVSIMQSTGEFEICENNSVAATGVIFMSEGVFLDGDQYPTVGDLKNKKISNEFHLTKEEVYKDLRLRGYEYGPTFQGIQRANQTGSNADLKWDGHWISFMDTMLQMQILPSHEQCLRLPTRIKSVKIDPRAQPTVSEGNEEALMLPAVSDSDLKMCMCGGVEIYGMDTAIAPRRSGNQQPILEDYRFVPYTPDSCQSVDPSLRDYCTGCLDFALESLRALMARDKENILPNRDLLDKVVQSHKQTSHKIDLSNLTNLPNSGLVQALGKIFELSVDKGFRENALNLMSSWQPKLASDMLLSNLDQPCFLKPALDLIHENNRPTSVSVFEVGANQSNLYSQIVPMLETHPEMRVQYTAADKTAGSKDCKKFNVKNVVWDIFSASSPPHGQFDLVVLKNVLHKHKDIDTALQMVSSMLKPDGFILVEEVTENFPLQLVLEAMTERLDTSSNNKGRVHGRYLSQAMWDNVFARNGFNVIYKRSDDLLSTLYLLRRKIEVTPTPMIMSVDDLECSWLEDLKSKVRSLQSAPKEARLWLVAKKELNGVVGLSNCLRFEEGGDKVRVVFVSNLNPSSQEPDLSATSKEFQSLRDKDLRINVYRDGQWGSFKHIPLPTDDSLLKKTSTHAYVNVLTRGDLSSLRWIQSPLQHYQPNGHGKDSKELCSVYYTSLNFRDIMLATGKLPPDALQPDVATQECILGLEFAGRNSKNERVMGMMPCKGLATFVDLKDHWLWKIPDHWSMEEAATVPIVYSTVIYALVIRGNIKRGEKILIHSGSGGVGQAAIRVALSYGCDVFTTVGSQEKKEFLKKKFPQLKDRNFANSRDQSFEFDILKETNGKGVDIVLNSLAEEKLQASIRLLARQGRFLEIGKFDLSKNSNLGMSVFLKNISFHGVVVDGLFADDAYEDFMEVHDKVQQGIDSGMVQPLITTVFDKDDLEDAFRLMAQGKHIGKVVIKIRDEETEKVTPTSHMALTVLSRTVCDPSKSYVVTGGLGGFGLELANWLVDRGAKKIVLTSRSGVKTGYQHRKIQLWKSLGVQVSVTKHNCTTLAGTRALVEDAGKLGPVGGVFNLAVVLRDGFLENQTLDMYREVMDPKVKGTINLDITTRELCKSSLDWFVIFSSVACGRGNLGQTNYAFANSVMERICEKRRSENLPALAIQWGAVGDVGIVAESMGGNDVIIGGSLPQRMNSCLTALDKFLNLPHAVVSSYCLPQAERKEDGKGKKQDLVEAVSKILGVKDINTIDPEVNLGELGLDSLMGVEIRQLLDRDYNMPLDVKEIRQLTMNKLHTINDAEDDDDTTQTSTKEKSSSLTVSCMQRFNVKEFLAKQTLVRLNDVQNSLKPLFFIHPIEGNIESLRDVAASLPFPVYGLQLTANTPLTSVEAMAEHYLQSIYTVDSSGPYRLAGYSYGCVIAVEMACQLQKVYPHRKDIVQSLTLLDGSHCFVEMYSNTFRRILNMKSTKEEVAGALSTFVKQFIDVESDLALYQDMLKPDDTKQQIAAAVDLLMKTKLFPVREDMETLARSFYHLLINSENCKTPMYKGDITLIKASDNSVLSVAKDNDLFGEDYNLNKVCDGKVSIATLEGDHMSFLIREGAKRVANIMIPILQ